MMTGFFVTFLTSLVTSAAASGHVPKAIPPPWTLGQLMFTSSQPIWSQGSSLRQISTYSSVEKPLTLAMTFLSKHLASLGSSSSMTLSTPGFWSPTEFIMPAVHSAILGVGLPNRGLAVVPLNEKVPSLFISYSSANSYPYPNVPLAAITGLSRVMPHKFTFISAISLLPFSAPGRPCIFSCCRIKSHRSIPYRLRTRSPFSPRSSAVRRLPTRPPQP